MATDPTSVGAAAAGAVISFVVSLDKWIDVASLKTAVKTLQDELKTLRRDLETLATSYQNFKKTRVHTPPSEPVPPARARTGSQPAVDDYELRDFLRRLADIEDWRKEFLREEKARARDEAEESSLLREQLARINLMLEMRYGGGR